MKAAVCRPALRVRAIKATCGAVGHGGAAPAVRQKLAAGTFFKGTVVPVSLHVFEPDMGQIIFKDAHSAWQTAAGVNVAVGQYGQMAVAAVAATVDYSRFRVFGNLKLSCFIVIQRPQMVLSSKICSDASVVLD